MERQLFAGKYRGAVLAGLLAIFLLTVLVNTTRPQGGQGDRQLKDLGLAEFAQTEMTYDGVMHELYWHYEFANQMIRVNRIDDAKAHLRMLPFYVNLLPFLNREKKFFKDPEAVKKFDTYAQDLINITEQLSKSLGTANADAAGKEMQKRIDYLCFHCHKDLKTPIRDLTPYGKKIEMSPGSGQPQGGRTRIHQ